MYSRFFLRASALVLLALAVLAGACGPREAGVSFEPKPKWGASTAVKPLDDLKELPQDANAYLDKSKADQLLLSAEAARMRSSVYLERLFGPWRASNPAYARKSATKSLAAYSRNPGYDDSGQMRLRPWSDRIAWNANMRYFGSQRRPAIAVANTNLRAIPTLDHRLGPPGRPGQGYPFDMLQVSALWIGTPVLVDHVSRDGAWALVETAIAPGWVRMQDLAFVDDAFIAQYTARPFATVIKENVPLSGGASAGVGAVLPVEETDGVRLKIAVPAPGPGGRASTVSVWLTQGEAALMPLAATPANIAVALNQMMGQTYGWGGLDGKRDCSATTRDALAPFGVWLPRNSAAQARTGTYIPLEGMSPQEKEQAILKNGVPFSTLIWMPGHILLYIGQYKGHPIVFHNVWGMRTIEPNGSEGRRVIGKTVITTLRVGEIYPEVGPERILLNRVRGMTLVAPTGGKEGLEPDGENPEESQQ